MDRLYIVAPTPYGTDLPDLDGVTRVYRDHELGEAREYIADAAVDQFDVDDPDTYRLYELRPVTRPTGPSWQTGGDPASVSRRRAMDLIDRPIRNH